MKRVVASIENRQELINQVDELYTKLCDEGRDFAAEDILEKYHASEDDSGEEGFMTTMSNDDLKNAAAELKALFRTNSAQSIIDAMNAGDVSAEDAVVYLASILADNDIEWSSDALLGN